MGAKISKTQQINCGGDLLTELPEECIVAVIGFTSPADACRLATVSRSLKSVAYSDAVWMRFLPSDINLIVSRSDSSREFLDSLSKKELFFLLHRPILIDGGTKSISLDLSTCKKCCCISAKDLVITWGDTPKYWSWNTLPESRFSKVAELINVCWLEIQGRVKLSMLSPDTCYGVYFVFKMTKSSFGFCSPAKVGVKTSQGKTETRDVYLDPEEIHNYRQIIPRHIRVFHRNRTVMTVLQPPVQQGGEKKVLPTKRDDGWMEVEIGEFLTQRDDEEEVEMSVMEVDNGNWKGGLVVEGFEIRPKTMKPDLDV